MFNTILNKPNIKQILVLLFASVFICLPLLSSQIDISYDDGIQHIARLIGTDASIKEGQTEVMSDFCNGFGYSWNLFYSPLTAFTPLIFRIFNCSYVDCIKLFMFVVTFLSGLTMYFFVNEVTKNKKMALIAGIVYMFSPYRYTDMYIRNALAELTSFIFIPMVFQGLYGVLKQKPKKEILLIIASILLVLTHTIITIYVAIICFIYLISQARKLKIKNVRIKLIYSVIIILVITSFFWMPLLQVKNSAEYEVFKPGRMERQDVLIALKLDLENLFFTKKTSNMIYEIGLFNIVALIGTPFVIKKIKNKYKGTDFYNFYIFAIIGAIILLIMTLKVFPFEKLPETLRMLQFTFRLLEFTSFFIAFIVAVNVGKLIKNIKSNHVIAVLIINMILSLFFINHLYYTNNLNEEWLIPAVPVTEKTGRVHAGCASFEYLPTKAFENRSYIETRSNDVIVINGEAQITNTEKEKSKMSFNIDVNEEAELELPYIYYPGYTATVKETNTKLETFETDKGFVGIKVTKLSNTEIKVEYTGTTIMIISKVISILGICVLIIYIIKNKEIIEFISKKCNIIEKNIKKS